MKYCILGTIRLYQLLLSPLQILFPTTGCRFWPTCSEYTYQAIEKNGVIRGVRLGAIRLLKCNPWS